MMKKYFSPCLLLILFSCRSWAHEEWAKPQISVQGDKVYVATPAGKKQILSSDHEVASGDVKMEDLTFNGYLDLKIIDEQGATQIFYKVYLYYPARGIYVLSKIMSEIPCLQVDAVQRRLVGACFHASSCENWTEQYSVNRRGILSLIERNGAFCDPTGQVYSYVDRFRNGKQVSSKITPVHDASLELSN